MTLGMMSKVGKENDRCRGGAYLNDGDQDKRIIIFEIHRVVTTNSACNCLDNSVSVELRVADYRRANGKL